MVERKRCGPDQGGSAPLGQKPITVEELNDRLLLDPATGQLFWRASASQRPQWNGRYAGQEAGWSDGRYLKITLGRNRCINAHRTTFALHNGRMPDGEIDHINGDKIDNRPENLREASSSQNKANAGMRRDNTSGFRGVVFDKTRGQYKAIVQFNGRVHFFGYFHRAEDAAVVRNQKAKELFGDFARKE